MAPEICQSKHNRGDQSIYLHRSGPLPENSFDRPENRYGRYGFASFLPFPYLPYGWMEAEFASDDYLILLSVGTVQEPPTRTSCLKSAGSTPPICTTVRPPFVTLPPRRPPSPKERETPQYASHLYSNTPPICTAVRLPFLPAILLAKYHRFAEKKPYFHNVRAIRANHLKPAIRNFWPLEARFAKKGFGSGTLKRFARIRRFARICKSIRANRAI